MTQKEFLDKVKHRYGNKYEVIGKFKGLKGYILIKDQYGILKVRADYLLYTPKEITIKSALNRTSYFMSKLKEKQPAIYDMLYPVSEYKTNEDNMLFDTKYGVISTKPSNLLSGKVPGIRTAIDRKTYRLNQFKEIHGDKYEYNFIEGTATESNVEITCPLHGKFIQKIDNHMQGKGCRSCNHKPSTLLYLVQLTDDIDQFIKVGISRKSKSGYVRRYYEYKKSGYKVDILLEHEFESEQDSRRVESLIKTKFKALRIVPSKWPYENPTECFTLDIKSKMLEELDLVI